MAERWLRQSSESNVLPLLQGACSSFYQDKHKNACMRDRDNSAEYLPNPEWIHLDKDPHYRHDGRTWIDERTVQEVPESQIISSYRKRPLESYDFFISHRAAADRWFARKLFIMLNQRGKSVFWDYKCLEEGKNWEEGFLAALSSCKVVVVLCSAKVTCLRCL